MHRQSRSGWRGSERTQQQACAAHPRLMSQSLQPLRHWATAERPSGPLRALHALLHASQQQVVLHQLRVREVGQSHEGHGLALPTASMRLLVCATAAQTACPPTAAGASVAPRLLTHAAALVRCLRLLALRLLALRLLGWWRRRWWQALDVSLGAKQTEASIPCPLLVRRHATR